MIDQIYLSEKQKEIVNYNDEPILVKASAGSGKTRVLTERIKYHLENTNKKILALTFTNKAGVEIKERLEKIESINSRTFIGTFHSFCQYVLENHGHLVGFSEMRHIFENPNDRIELVDEVLSQIPYFNNMNFKGIKEKNKFSNGALDFISRVKREVLSIEDLSKENLNLVLFYENYQELLQSQNAIDFDDLLLYTYNLFTNYPKVASLYRQSFYGVYVDEAQDLNKAQYMVLVALCGSDYKNVMLVGDEKQSIYGFNSSSHEFMTKNYVNDYNPKVFVLNENFRSSESVVKAANFIIGEKECDQTFAKYGDFKLLNFSDPQRESKWIIKKIKELISLKNHSDIEGEINYEKIAILARNRYVFLDVEKELIKENIPFYYKMSNGVITFSSDVMKIFDLALKIKINSKDELHSNKLNKIFKKENPLHTKIFDLVNQIENDGKNIKTLFNDFKMNLNNENEGELISNEIEELLSHWHSYAISTDNKSLQQFKNSMALGKTFKSNSEKGITLSTVHTMKGQEYDIVFIVGADEGTFPDYRAKTKADLEQEKNNMYVAFTRAKRFLYVSYPSERTMPWGDVVLRKLSQFLISIEQNLGIEYIKNLN